MGNLFFIGSIFISFFSIYLILFRNKNQNHFSDRILVALFLSYIYCTIGFLLITSGWIINVPFLYRTSAPFNFLIPPLAYLYVRSILYNETKFKKTDYLHVIPFLLFIINYLPFYCKEYDDKLLVVLNVVKEFSNNYLNQDGFLNENIQVFRPIQSVIYLILQWKLILNYNKHQFNNTFKEHTTLIIDWVKKFTIGVSFTVFTYLIYFIGVFYNKSSHFLAVNVLIFYSSIPVALSLFYLSINVVLQGELYIGIPYFEESPTLNNNLTSFSSDVKEIDYKEELDAIKAYFEKHQPYLQNNLLISEISVKLGIHVKIISFVINQFFGQNFNEFVNSYRIKYVIELMKNGELKHYTLNAIGSKAGFSNKTSFINAFKKFQNCTPTQYMFNNNIHN